MNEKLYWIGLSHLAGLPTREFLVFLMKVENIENLWKNPQSFEKKADEKIKKILLKISNLNKTIDLFKEEEKLNTNNISFLSYNDPDYPEGLRNIENPPIGIYYKGKLPQNPYWGLGIVGTRKCSKYGEIITHQLAFQASKNDFWVISGMARGIDTSAHKGALDASGKTIAVLGTGIDITYPPENKTIKEKISQNGAVISEFPMGTEPKTYNFPIRNRIISALSDGILLVEAPLKSGAMITANYALEQGKEVFALPGNVNLINSKGPNSLIKDGARLIENIEDILDEFKLPLLWKGDKNASIPPDLTFCEKKLVDFLCDGQKRTDLIMAELKVPIGELSAILLSLELKKMISRVPGDSYILRI